MRRALLLVALAACKHGGGTDANGCPDDAYRRTGDPPYCLALPPGFQKLPEWGDEELDGEMFGHLMAGNDRSIYGGDIELFKVHWTREADAGPALLRDLGRQSEDSIVTVVRQTPTFAVVKASRVIDQTSAIRFYAAAFVTGADRETITCSYSSRFLQVNPGEQPPDEPTNAHVCETLRALPATR